MDILIQNTGATPFFINMMKKVNGTTGLTGRINLEADNQITKVPEELYLSKIKENPFFKKKIESGILIILNDVGIKPSQAMAEAAASRELGYARYKGLLIDIERQGGLKNAELAPYLDGHGMPNLNLVRANMGQVDPDKIAEYKNRFIAERNDGMTISLPRNKKLSAGSSEFENEMKAIEKAKPEVKPIEKEEVKEEVKSPVESKPKRWTKKELLALAEDDKAELHKIADLLNLEFSKKIPSEKLIERILEFQEVQGE